MQILVRGKDVGALLGQRRISGYRHTSVRQFVEESLFSTILRRYRNSYYYYYYYYYCKIKAYLLL